MAMLQIERIYEHSLCQFEPITYPGILKKIPISARLSKEVQEVVPSVADTKNGIKPIALSSSIPLCRQKRRRRTINDKVKVRN